MSLEKSERIHYYIAQAVRESGDVVAEQYDRIDTTDVHVGARLDRIVYRAIRRDEFIHTNRRVIRIIKRAALCAVISISIVLMLVFTIAAAKGNLWNAMIQWYEDHFSIHFGSIDEGENHEPERLPPFYLKEMYAPTLGPSYGLEMKVERRDLSDYKTFVLGYYDEEDLICTYQQGVWGMDLTPAAKENYITEDVTINGRAAQFWIEADGDNTVLVWDDGTYRYKLESEVFIRSDLTEWAESIRVTPNLFPAAIKDIRRPVIDSTAVRAEVDYQEPSYIGTQYYRGNQKLFYFIQSTYRAKQYRWERYGSPIWAIDLPIGSSIGIAHVFYGETVLVWQDDEYEYQLISDVMTMAEIASWAQRVGTVGTAMDSIQQILSPKGLDDDIEEKIWEKSRRRIEIDYYRDDTCIASFAQMLLSDGAPTGGYGYTEEEIQIHHAKGIVRYYSNKIVLIWNDDSYRYRLTSDQLTYDELISWAWSVAPPMTVEQVRKPSDVPSQVKERYTGETETAIGIIYTEGDKTLCTFTQSVLYGRDNSYDLGCEIQNVSVNSQPGMMLFYPNGTIILTWSDGSYYYDLQTATMSATELMKWAESVSPVPTAPEQGPGEATPPDIIKRIKRPAVSLYGWSEQSTTVTDQKIVTDYYHGDCYVGQFIQTVMKSNMLQYEKQCVEKYATVQQGKLRYELVCDDDRRILIWTDGKYKYRLELEKSYNYLLYALADTMN